MNMRNLLIFIILLTNITNAQDKEFTFFSKSLQQKRTVKIHLPNNYNSNNEYPVIYLFDGNILHEYTVGLYKYNSDYYPNSILVSVNQINRSKELTLNENFYTYFLDELIPKIDEKYKTNDFNIAIGHSFGGAFVLQSSINAQKIKAVISISPTITKNNFRLIESFEKQLINMDNKYIYIGYGENDFSYLMKDSDKLHNLLQKKFKKSIESKLEVFKEEDHTSSILIGIRKGLKYVFKDMVLPESLWDKMDEINDSSIFEKYFKDISEKYKSRISPTEDDLNAFGYFNLRNNNIDKALVVFKNNIKRFPESSNTYDSYAEGLEKKGNYKLAKKFYKKAIKTEENNDNDFYQKQVFIDNLKRLDSITKIK